MHRFIAWHGPILELKETMQIIKPNLLQGFLGKDVSLIKAYFEQPKEIQLFFHTVILKSKNKAKKIYTLSL